MPYDWTALQRSAAVEELLSKQRIREALQLLKREAARRPDDDVLAMQLADVYVLAEMQPNAIRVLRAIANHLASHGQASRAIAALKKLQSIDPAQEGLYDAIASAIHDEGSAGASFSIPLDDEELDVGGIQAAEPVTTSARVVDDSSSMEAVPSELFDGFSRDELLAVMRGLELLVFDPGDIIVSEGDPGDSIFVLSSGIAKAFVRQAGGFKMVRTLHDGDFFGEISLLHGGARTATVTAATRCELLELDRATLDSITATHPHVRDVLQRVADERR